MLEAAFAGAVTGFAIAIPVGAIAVLIIHTGLTRGLRVGVAAAAGAASSRVIAAASSPAAIADITLTILIPLRWFGADVDSKLAKRRAAGISSARGRPDPAPLSA